MYHCESPINRPPQKKNGGKCEPGFQMFTLYAKHDICMCFTNLYMLMVNCFSGKQFLNPKRFYDVKGISESAKITHL
jgi:hypothetical protein